MEEDPGLQQDAVPTTEDLARVPGQVQEWLRQDNLAFVALIALGLVMVQPFLTAPSLDRSATVCVVGFAIALPLLAGLILLNSQETFRQQASGSLLASVAKTVGQLSAFVGAVAGFWHMTWIAGTALLAASVFAVAIHSAGYSRLERFRRPGR